MRDQKRNQVITKMKEIRMQPKIEQHDLNTKSKFIGDFLTEGNKVKVSIRFRGRELAHTELGKVVLDRILAQLTDNGVGYVVDRPAMMEGRMMSMILSPAKTSGPKKNHSNQYPAWDSEYVAPGVSCSLWHRKRCYHAQDENKKVRCQAVHRQPEEKSCTRNRAFATS